MVVPLTLVMVQGYPAWVTVTVLELSVSWPGFVRTNVNVAPDLVNEFRVGVFSSDKV
jgi:hypothetical protein